MNLLTYLLRNVYTYYACSTFRQTVDLVCVQRIAYRHLRNNATLPVLLCIYCFVFVFFWYWNSTIDSADLITAIDSFHLSVCLFAIYFSNRLTFGLDLLHASGSRLAWD